MFRVQQHKKCWTMWPEDEGTVIFQNIMNELPTNTA